MLRAQAIQCTTCTRAIRDVFESSHKCTGSPVVTKTLTNPHLSSLNAVFFFRGPSVYIL